MNAQIGIHNSPNPLFHQRDVEIQEKPDATSSELQIRDQLRLVDRREFLHALQFDDHASVYARINSIASTQLNPLVLER